MNRLFIPVVLVLLFFATSAHAADREGIYFSGNFGVGLLTDADNEQAGVVLESRFDPGLNVSGAIGYDFGNFRTEGEVTYHRNEVDEIVAGGSVATAEGTVSALSIMANVYYDFGSKKSFVEPYFGAGAGIAYIDSDMTVVATQFVDDSAEVFAYQFMAGLGFNISSSTTVTVGYRYFATADPEFNDTMGGTFDSEYLSHSVNIGLRFTF